MQTDALKKKWAAGDTTLGLWIAMREPLVAEAAASSGYDYVCVDMQHGMSDLRDMAAALQAMASGSATPIARVPWNEPGIIGRALDLGAMGVVIPMVNSVAEAEAAVAACRYAPVGKRSFGPVVPGVRVGGGYYASANEHVACIPMIETKQAVEHIDEILAVPGIDAIYVGPADLSITYGLPPGGDNPDAVFQDALTTIVAACRRHGVIPGIHATPALTGIRHEQGFRMITVTSDLLAATGGIRADLATGRAGVAGEAAPGASKASGPY